MSGAAGSMSKSAWSSLILRIEPRLAPRRVQTVAGEFDAVVNRKLHCSPCEEAKCAFNYECMKLVSADEVFDTAKMMIEGYE